MLYPGVSDLSFRPAPFSFRSGPGRRGGGRAVGHCSRHEFCKAYLLSRVANRVFDRCGAEFRKAEINFCGCDLRLCMVGVLTVETSHLSLVSFAQKTAELLPSVSDHFVRPACFSVRLWTGGRGRGGHCSPHGGLQGMSAVRSGQSCV